jgi:hypothetical protein
LLKCETLFGFGLSELGIDIEIEADRGELVFDDPKTAVVWARENGLDVKNEDEI